MKLVVLMSSRRRCLRSSTEEEERYGAVITIVAGETERLDFIRITQTDIRISKKS